MSTNRIQEEALYEAFAYLNEHEGASYRSVALIFLLNKTTLINHYGNYTKPLHHAHHSQQRFTEEENRVVQWIIELDDMGMPPREHFVRELLLGILRDCEDRIGGMSARLGKDFINGFGKRHPMITS
ncbi:hypothetical protein HOY80DRAFT_881646 [Tuber brumale]|nr:hypothetical protein HOY80DRAFT_881646 [Tuber brumale]